MTDDRDILSPLMAPAPGFSGQRTALAFLCFLILASCQFIAPAALALAQHVAREQDIADLKVGQRIKVDDGTCPAGQVKEISGTKMSSTGVVRSRKCIPRLGPKQGTSAVPPRP